MQPKYGFELYLNSDFPLGSGLGSATLSAAILGCFNILRKDQWNQYELAEIAFQAETKSRYCWRLARSICCCFRRF